VLKEKILTEISTDKIINGHLLKLNRNVFARNNRSNLNIEAYFIRLLPILFFMVCNDNEVFKNALYIISA